MSDVLLLVALLLGGVTVAALGMRWEVWQAMHRPVRRSNEETEVEVLNLW